METQTTTASAAQEASLPQAEVVPTHVAEDGSSVEIGYTANDPSGQTAKENQPGLLAGKFKSPEELEKAYKELEAKLGQPKQQEEEQKLPEIDPNAPKIAGIDHTDEATSMLQEKGLDINTFTREYETTGQLSDASYTALEAKGITRDMVDAYIEGQRVLVETQVTDIKNSVGGEAEYQKIITWASANLSADEQRAYDNIMATSNVAAIKMAAAGLKARYETVMGRSPSVVVGGSASTANDGLGAFENVHQMVAAMKDPRYDTDPDYRQRVERRVINSKF